MKKLAVIFPGVGYTCTKPLLYYTASMAAERGYEIIRLDYGQDIHTFHGRTPTELEPIIKLAIKRTLPQLENVPFSEYDDYFYLQKHRHHHRLPAGNSTAAEGKSPSISYDSNSFYPPLSLRYQRALLRRNR